MTEELNLRRVDTRSQNVHAELNAIREQLSPRGDVVSESGRQRTIETFGEPLTPQEVVAKICEEVRERGLEAVLSYTEKLDKATLTPDQLRVPAAELQQAHADASPEFLDVIRKIRDNVWEFQTAILHSEVNVTRPGVSLRQRYVPLARAGLCVPGGAAAYPSTVLMTALPAMAAGVKELAVVAPPTKFGAYNPDLLATCHELGISEVYRVGGAQGVAALAYGVDGLPKVDKIVGPGNLFVALAKNYVFGEVDIDSIAGPSEVVLIADETVRPDFAAADLLAQAEHAPGASILVCWNDQVIEDIAAELNSQVSRLERADLTVQSLEAFAALIRVKDEAEACEITDWLAPEHLHISTANAAEMANKIRNAGATFVGHFTPVALGDYAAGPSHVLPTGGTARWASGLSSNDFLRSGSVIEFNQEALAEIAPAVQALANKEGLTAHRCSVDIRLSE